MKRIDPPASGEGTTRRDCLLGAAALAASASAGVARAAPALAPVTPAARPGPQFRIVDLDK